MDVDDVAVVSMMFCDTTGLLAYPTWAHPGKKKKSGGYPATEIGMTASRMP